MAALKGEIMDDDDGTIDRLRKINQRQGDTIKQLREDAQVACLEVHRLYAPAWEQPSITRAIDQIRDGLQPDFVPHALEIEKALDGIDAELEKCREILRRK